MNELGATLCQNDDSMLNVLIMELVHSIAEAEKQIKEAEIRLGKVAGYIIGSRECHRMQV